MRPGGPEEDQDNDDVAEDEQDAKRTDETREPVFYNTLTYKTVEECIHSFNLQGIIDLTADCGDKAVAAAAAGILYAGVCMTDAHASLLKWRIQEQIYRLFSQEGHRLYQAKLATITKSHTTFTSGANVTTQKSVAPPAEAGAKDKKKRSVPSSAARQTSRTKVILRAHPAHRTQLTHESPGGISRPLKFYFFSL